MGFGSSFKKLTRTISKPAATLTSPFGAGLSSIGAAAVPALPGFLGDVLFGKKAGGAPRSPLADTAEGVQKQALGLQSLGLAELAQEAKSPLEDINKLQISGQLKGLESAKDDAIRSLQGLLARTGIQNSSIGLGQQVGLERDFLKDRASLLASAPERLRQLRIQRASQFINPANAVIGTNNIPIRFEARPDTRGGGLLDILGLGAGALIGAKAGGPFGALVGSQIGLGGSQAIRGAFGG